MTRPEFCHQIFFKKCQIQPISQVQWQIANFILEFKSTHLKGSIFDGTRFGQIFWLLKDFCYNVHCPCLLHIKFFVHNLRGPQRKFSILHWEKSWLGNPAKLAIISMYLHLQEFSSYIRTIWIYCCHCVLVSVLLPEEKRVLRRISFDPLPVHRTLRAQSKRATKKIYPCTFTEINILVGKP